MTPKLEWTHSEVVAFAAAGAFAMSVSSVTYADLRPNGFRVRIMMDADSGWQVIRPDHATEAEAQVAAETRLRGVLLAATRELDPEFGRLDAANKAMGFGPPARLIACDHLGQRIRKWSEP